MEFSGLDCYMETPNLLQVGGGKISSYKGHIVGGIISFVLLIGGWLYFLDTKFSLPNILIMLGIVILFALFPDVDTNSKGQYIFYGMILIGDIFFLAIKEYKIAAIIGFLALLPIVGKHRGWTHTIWAMVAVPLPLVILPYYVLGLDLKASMPYYLAAVSGYFSHLLLDRKFF